LSKSSWSYRFIFEAPKFVHRKRSRIDAVPLTTVEGTFGFRDVHRTMTGNKL
jgi:hypothetical protein